MNTLLIIALVGSALVVAFTMWRHQRDNVRMHSFVDKVMAPREDQQPDSQAQIEQR